MKNIRLYYRTLNCLCMGLLKSTTCSILSAVGGFPHRPRAGFVLTSHGGPSNRLCDPKPISETYFGKFIESSLKVNSISVI